MPDDADRESAATWLADVVAEVTAEYRARFERHILRRCGVERLADVPGAVSDPDDLRHLARDLHVLGEAELGLSVRRRVDPDARSAAQMYHPQADSDLLRRGGGTDSQIGERAEIAERIWGRCRYLIGHDDYAQATALADAWRTHAGVRIHGDPPDPQHSHAITQRVIRAWGLAMYAPTTAESLARLGYMDEWDLERAGWSRAAGDLGRFGDPRGPHRAGLADGRDTTLEQFERMARAAIDRPDLFGGVEPPQLREAVDLPLSLDALGDFAASYADDPAFLGWAVAYAIEPNPWPYPDENDALFRQAVYITGSLRAQTPAGERTVTACALVGRYYTDEADTKMAAAVARDHLEAHGLRSGITMPIDDAEPRHAPATTPFRGGRMVERGADLIRTPQCDHPGASWQPGALRDSYGRSSHHHDTLSLDCPHCGERRLATLPAHRAQGHEIPDLRWYLGRERMHTVLRDAPTSFTLHDLRQRDGYAEMSPGAYIAALAPLRPEDDLMTTLFS